jgi:hypothetical protein
MMAGKCPNDACKMPKGCLGLSQQASKQAGQPASKPASRPASGPASRPASRPAGKPASKPAGQQASQPASQPASKQASQPVSKQASQPASQPTIPSKWYVQNTGPESPLSEPESAPYALLVTTKIPRTPVHTARCHFWDLNLNFKKAH